MLEERPDKTMNNSTLGLRHLMRGGLGRTLLVMFLLISLVPMTIVSIISYRSAHNSLYQNAKKSLVGVTRVKTEYINDYFKRITNDLTLQSEMTKTIQFLEKMSKAFKNSGKSIEDFSKSYDSQLIIHEYAEDFRNIQRHYNYHDIFLIDPEGNVLFSLLNKDDFGINLFSGKYSNSLFAKASQKTLENGITTFSDFEFYKPSDDIAGFVTALIVDESGEKIGLLAVQIKLNDIDRILHTESGLGETEDVYLVGPDLRMRSNSRLEKGKVVFGKAVETRQTVRWKEHHIESEIEEHDPSYTATIYKGRRGVSVLGFHGNVKICGVHMAMLAEIDESEAFGPVKSLRYTVIVLVMLTIVLVFAISSIVTGRIVRPILELSRGTKEVASGDLSKEINIKTGNEIGDLAKNFNVMLRNLRKSNEESDRLNWLKSGNAELAGHMRGNMSLEELCNSIITFIANYLRIPIGLLYVNSGDDIFRLKGSYAYKPRVDISNEFNMGEGLIGQSALEKKIIVLSDVPDDYIHVTSGLGEQKPSYIVVTPLVYNNEVQGVLEIGSLEKLTEVQTIFLEQAAPSIAIAISSAQSQVKLQDALDRSQQMTEELQSQQEELRTSNEELEEQTNRLKASEEKLKAQQEELQASNEELEEKTHSLEEQRQDISRKNLELENTKTELEQKAKELEITGKYKSEFLANMSHELRTPLNSLLILAGDLADNKKKNLDNDQVESANIIYGSGQDLLKLINEILDLSKIEAGKMSINPESVALSALTEGIKTNFGRIIQEKGLEMSVKIEDGLPATIVTDHQRIDQILKNLISNAVKFTEKGSITIDIHRPDKNVDLSRSRLNPTESLGISVTDTGIGIPENKRLEIFEAFQQVDGTTSRKHGGTGLGLSISRELARLLGGEIKLDSPEGKGSRFTLYIPLTYKGEPESTKEKTDRIKRTVQEQVLDFRHHAVQSIKDDREGIVENDRVILVIEDDLKFAEILYKFSTKRNFKCIHAGDGETGLELAEKFKPDAIILDIKLPGIQGWSVLEALKKNSKTRHIPVHMMSVEEESIEAYRRGVIGYLTKPVETKQLEEAFSRIEKMISGKLKSLLLVEDVKIQQKNILELIGNGDVKTKVVGTGKEAIDEIKTNRYDCVILDLTLSDMTGFEVLKQLSADKELELPPIIVYTAREITREEDEELQRYTSSIIIKGVSSNERLLDETALFLHRIVDKMPKEKQKMITSLYEGDTVFEGRKILLVDDDMRNVYAIAKVLEGRGLEVLKASNGQKALDILDADNEISLVLMDIMMPVMDGYETMQRIRAQERFRNLPILALTAKAMKEDRKKCIDAGANDYLTKPVDIDRLLSALRVWLYR